MFAIISLLVILTLSLIVTRIASVALRHTGLGREAARFQARSAFTGVGFTTTESESMMNNPVRRRILMVLMLLGNAGIVTAVASLILGFTNTQGMEQSVLRLGLLIGGLLVLWILATSDLVDGVLSRTIAWGLRRFTRIDARDYARLLHVCGDDWGVGEITVSDDDWVANRTLAELDLTSEGVLVLGIQRSVTDYLGTPRATTRIEPGDSLVVYGRAPRIAELECRCAGAEGDAAHESARNEADA